MKNQIEFGVSEKAQENLDKLAKQFGFKNKLEFIEAIADVGFLYQLA